MDWGHLLGRIHAPGLKSKGVSIDVCSMIDRYLSLDGALGAELQQAMTPAEAVELLKDGLRRSTSGETSTRNRTDLLSDAAGGQYPYAAVLSCIDSRAPVEQIFDAASGDLFVARVAGNVASPDLTASLEYAQRFFDIVSEKCPACDRYRIYDQRPFWGLGRQGPLWANFGYIL